MVHSSLWITLGMPAQADGTEFVFFTHKSKQEAMRQTKYAVELENSELLPTLDLAMND